MKLQRNKSCTYLWVSRIDEKELHFDLMLWISVPIKLRAFHVAIDVS